MITLENGVLHIETRTQTATMENGRFTSLVSKATGKSYVAAPGGAVGSSILWMNGDCKRLDTGKIEVHLLGEDRAEFVFHSWYGDGVTMVSCHPETGDILVRPGAGSGRVGVKAVQWEIAGISPELNALVPTCQGIRMKLDDPLLAGGLYEWPISWEAGLCIFESDGGDGFWIHCRDTKYTYKDLAFGEGDQAGTVTLSTQAYGPLDNNKSAGGLVWRVNCFEGGWRTPAKIYRDWYWAAYDLAAEKAKRLPWLSDVTMAMCWTDTNTACLDALAKQVDPSKVLLHMAQWRDYKYDQDYPEYDPSAAAAKYIEYGASLGFHIAPHMNSMEIDPSHPVYRILSDYQMLHTDTKTVYGWGWDGPNWRYLGVPWTEYAKTDPRNRDYNIMTKIHTGSSMWQSVLYERMKKLADHYPVAGCFIDVTLCSYNLHNCLVEGKTSSEGLNDMIKLLGEIRGGLPIGGEGLNEITAQGLSFAQMHLYRSGHISCEGLERAGGDCAINHFLFGDLCMTVGYHGLAGRNEDEILRSRIYDDHNTIPTIITNNPEEILHPNKTLASIFERANSCR